MKRWTGLDAVLVLITAATGIVLYAPLVAVIALSFFQLERWRGAIHFAPFSLEPYARLVANGSVMGALSITLLVGVIATVLALIIGLVCAFFYLGSRGALRQVMQVLIFIPFLLPPIITGLSLLIAFRELSIARGIMTIVVGHVVFVLPLVYRTVLARLQNMGRSLTEASLDLGASRVQTLWLVVLPQMRPALVAAALLAFATSFDETLITLFLAGSDSTLPIRLWGMMRVGFVPEINALATVIFVFAAFITVTVALLQGRDRTS